MVHTPKFTKYISVIILLTLPLSALAQPPDPAFNPNRLVEDKVFSDVETFGGAAGVQKFLADKNSVLANTSYDFLVKLKEPQALELKQALDDPQPNLGRLRTAAELIWDASVQSGLNPQVILVTLNKEQGLITSANDFNAAKLQKALDRAMGFDCPDGSGCGDLFPGFYYQLFGNYDSAGNRYLGAAKSLMKSFSTPGGRGPIVNGQPARTDSSITLDNTLGGYDNILSQQSVTLLNNATAALYRYTPHVFNGNYNFWKFFQGWFKYPNGSLLKLSSGSDVYIIQDGLKALVPQFVAQARALNLSNIITVSPTEFGNYTTDKPLGPADNTIVAIPGEASKFVFISNTRHQASDLVISQRGLNPKNTLVISASEAALFDVGTVLPPKDGTIIRGAADKSVYLVDGGKIKMYSAYTFAQNKIIARQIVIVPDAEVASYSQNGFVPPKDGSLVKSSSDSTVYLVQSGLRQPVLGDVFKNRGFSFKQVVTVSSDELNALAMGLFAAPKDYTFFATGAKAGPVFEFKDGAAHSVSPYVAKQRGIKPDYVFDSDVVLSWLTGIPVPPRDNTILKGDASDAVYLVTKGQLRPLTYKAYLNRKITPKKIVTLPQSEVDAYAKGDAIEK